MRDISKMFLLCSMPVVEMEAKVTEGERIEMLRQAAKESGFTMDFLDHLSMGLSNRAFRKFIGNVSSSPSYMKSKDSPYVFRKARAAANPT